MAELVAASDLHGDPEKYRCLFRYIRDFPPEAVVLAGDLFPHYWYSDRQKEEFVKDFLKPELEKLFHSLPERRPTFWVILGNDDSKVWEEPLRMLEEHQMVHYIHNKIISWKSFRIFGYNFVPPTPFPLKDWEKYDISRYVDPGATHPVDDFYSPKQFQQGQLDSIMNDLRGIPAEIAGENLICLFHSPPYQTPLDRADLDQVVIDGVPADVHVGSIAIRQFIESRQPFLTFHGHVHEAYRLTGQFMIRLGKSLCFNVAHEGEPLAVVRLSTDNPARAKRMVLEY